MHSLIFLFGFGVGVAVAWFFMRETMERHRIETDRMEKEKQEEEEIAKGLEGFNEEVQKRIEGRKAKIIHEIQQAGDVQNQEVADMLDVSSRTALRYLSELEKEGKIKQVEKFGRNVRYELRKKELNPSN
ncbi:MAG: winged helix-turn-helix domain-containing protein [Candidatus Moranbacteria bacterium]|nr:winged helix-turn-helix domain-containing protein [Candidatus Moranbacteria bacterium]